MKASVRELLERRRRRAISSILFVKEKHCDRYLPEEAGEALRAAVRTQISEFHDLVFDLLETLTPQDDSILINELWLDKLDEIYAAVVPGAS